MKKVLVLIFILLIGCTPKEIPPETTVAKGEYSPPRFWDVGDQSKNKPLPEDVEDGYLQFTKAPNLSFGLTMAHERISARSHERHDMLIYIHTGRGRFQVGDKEYFGSTGDLIYIPRGTVYSAYRQGELPLELLTVYSPTFDGLDIVYLEKSDQDRSTPSTGIMEDLE